jgi:hypothetical protein
VVTGAVLAIVVPWTIAAAVAFVLLLHALIRLRDLLSGRTAVDEWVRCPGGEEAQQ